MSKGNSGYFNGTLGTTYKNSTSKEESYSERGIDIPVKIKAALSKLKNKGDFLMTKNDSFSMKDVSIMSKESGVEFAKVSIEGKSYIIRGDKNGTVIPKSLLKKINSKSGVFEFHSHPHNDDLVPSATDIDMMKNLRRSTGQKYSTIVTPNGRTCRFDENGVIEIGTVSNNLDESHRNALIKLFGGKNNA